MAASCPPPGPPILLAETPGGLSVIKQTLRCLCCPPRAERDPSGYDRNPGIEQLPAGLASAVKEESVPENGEGVKACSKRFPRLFNQG